ncbi:MAG: universal stress protein [Planctomycetes bacterium]|nr:universal stress protein [Planctomycetota bacterium]
MNRHQRTLVALSATPADRAVVSYARLFASLGFARHYHFVHVRTPDAASESKKAADVLRECEALVAEVFGKPNDDVSSSCHVLTGERLDELIEFITAQRCDMVLMGHRKESSGLGSLALRLVMIGPCSVLMIPEGAPVAISEIMAPADFSDHSADSVQVAACIAQAAQIPRCVVTHVFSDPAILRYEEHTAAIRRNEQAAFDRFIEPINSHGVEMVPYFLEGNNVAGTILYAAERYGSNLLVMNTRGRSRAASILLGSVTSQVMTESPIAVLAVKHFGAMMNLFQALKESMFWTQPDLKTN